MLNYIKSQKKDKLKKYIKKVALRADSPNFKLVAMQLIKEIASDRN